LKIDLLLNTECKYFFDQCQHFSSSTLAHYKSTLRKLFLHFKESPHEASFKEFYRNQNSKGELLGTAPIDRTAIVDFFKSFPPEHQASKYDAICKLRVFFNVLSRPGAPLENVPNPTAGLRVKRSVSAKKDIIDVDEFKLLIRATSLTDNPKLAKAIISILFGTGIRVSELAELPLVSPEKLQTIIVPPIKSIHEYEQPLISATVESIKDYLNNERKHESPLLLVTPNGRKLTGQWVNQLIKELCILANIKKNILSHNMRHSFATALWDNGVSLSEIANLLNQTLETTATIYVHRSSSDQIRRMVNGSPLAKLVGDFWSKVEFLSPPKRM